ncbi:MAG TPA: diguanylate cyclase [Planktothrix sp.]|jgi:diguanylate cyclase (GGDEF)-like protein
MTSSQNSAGDSESARSRLGLLPVFSESVSAQQLYSETSSGRQLRDGLQAIPAVLQQLAASYFTGKLEIFSKHDSASIYYEDGTLVHAQIRDTQGDSAAREAISWLVGACLFNQQQRANEHTITRQLQSLIREGSVLLDQKKLLCNRGLLYESKLEREENSSLPDATRTQGELQKRIFNRVATPCTLTDLIRDLELEPWEWVPSVFHMLELQLIKIKQPRVKQNVLSFADPVSTGLIVLESEMRSAQTGLYTWEAMLLGLQREVHYHHETQRPLSLFVIEMESVPTGAIGGKAEYLTDHAVREIERKFDMIKKELDTFGHFEGSDFALILPNTSQSQALLLAKRLVSALENLTLNISTRPHTVNIHCGVATIPDIGSNLQAIISSAKLAKMQAKNIQQSIEIASLDAVSSIERGSSSPEPTSSNDATEHQTIDMKELLMSAGALTLEQLDQAAALMARLPVPLSLGKVLAMQGELKEGVILAAEELSQMVKEGRLVIEQATWAIELIAIHGLVLKTALKRIGIASPQPHIDDLGIFLNDAHMITERRLNYAARQAEITELPLHLVLTGAGILPRNLVRAAQELNDRASKGMVPRETAIAALQSMHKHSFSLPQALKENRFTQ